MKIAILCGGLGTRLSEETNIKPKPMVEIGGKPILWHIMKIYEKHGFSDFVLALGYKGEVIKNYFFNYQASQCDMEISLSTSKVVYKNSTVENWKVSLIDTGKNSMTGGRLLRLKNELAPHGTFMATYGDGLCSVDLSQLLRFHRAHGKIATVTSVRPPARFGNILIADGAVTEFKEKPQSGDGWINGGFFVFEPEVFNYINDDTTVLEQSPLERLASDGQLMAYQHTGYWQCMDTVRDRDVLNAICESNSQPWLTGG